MSRQQQKRPPPKRLPSSPTPQQTSVSLSVGYVHPDDISAHFAATWQRLLLTEQRNGRLNSLFHVRSGPKVDDARNQLFHYWLDETKDTHFLMVDTDMLLPVDTVDRLLAVDKPIASGLSFVTGFNSERVAPNIREIIETDNGPTIEPIWDYPQNTVMQVDAVGAACLLVQREVAETVLRARGKNHPAPWFAHGAHNGVIIGEDIAFCLTAQACGFEVWVDTGLVVGHIKPYVVDEAIYAQSLNMESHPRYDMREKVPAWQEFNGSS